MRVPHIESVFWIAVTFSFGCGDSGPSAAYAPVGEVEMNGDAGAGGSTTSGTDTSKNAAELTRAEARRLCLWMDTTFSAAASLEDHCTRMALLLVEDSVTPILPNECEPTAQACIAKGADPNGKICVESPSEWICVGPRAESEGGTCDFSGCMVTVAEVEECVRDLALAMGADSRAATCEAAGNGAGKDENWRRAADRGACRVFGSTCTNFLL